MGNHIPNDFTPFARGVANSYGEYTILSIERIAGLGEADVTLDTLIKAGLARNGDLVKVLGDGELKKKVNVQAHKFSKSAQEKITKSGGKAEVIGAA